MENFKILKGDKTKLPSTLENDVLYIALSQAENEYSEMVVDGQHFPSQQYIDKLIGDINKILNEL